MKLEKRFVNPSSNFAPNIFLEDFVERIDVYICSCGELQRSDELGRWCGCRSYKLVGQDVPASIIRTQAEVVEIEAAFERASRELKITQGISEWTP